MDRHLCPPSQTSHARPARSGGAQRLGLVRLIMADVVCRAFAHRSGICDYLDEVAVDIGGYVLDVPGCGTAASGPPHTRASQVLSALSCFAPPPKLGVG